MQFESMWGRIRRRRDDKESYTDRFERAASEHIQLAIYVPKPNATINIAPGSAVVGSPHLRLSNSVVIDYEGDIYGTGMTYEQQLHVAADRHVTAYPTSARSITPDVWLTRVGTYDVGAGTAAITEPEVLDAWKRKKTLTQETRS